MILKGLFYRKKTEKRQGLMSYSWEILLEKRGFSAIKEHVFPENVDFLWVKTKKIVHKVVESGKMWLL